MNKRWGTFIWIASALLVLQSCKTARIANRETTISRNADEVIERTSANDVDFSTASLKANITLSNGKQKLSFKASIRMKKDSAIWSSMTLMGIAGAKTLITPDSLKIVNYREKNYMLEPYSRLEEYINSDILTLENLQKLMLGDWLYMASVEKYRLKYNDTNYVVSTISERRLENDWVEKKIEKLERKTERLEERNPEKAQEVLEKKQERKPKKYEGLAIEIMVDPFDMKVRNMLVIDYFFESTLNTTYSNFKLVGDKKVPHKVDITVDGKKYLKVEIEYYKISLDENISIPFSIPSKYERVRL